MKILLSARSISELLLYAAASGAALALDVAVLYVLVSRGGWPYLGASVVSFVCGGVLLYGLSVRFVFEFRRIRNPALELPAFVALGAAGLLVNSVVIYAAVEFAHLYFLLAKLAAAGCTFAANFLLRRSLLFSRAVRLENRPAL